MVHSMTPKSPWKAIGHGPQDSLPWNQFRWYCHALKSMNLTGDSISMSETLCVCIYIYTYNIIYIYILSCKFTFFHKCECIDVYSTYRKNWVLLISELSDSKLCTAPILARKKSHSSSVAAAALAAGRWNFWLKSSACCLKSYPLVMTNIAKENRYL